MKIKNILIKALTKEIKRLKSDLKDERASLVIEHDFEDIVDRNNYLKQHNDSLIIAHEENKKFRATIRELTNNLNASQDNAKAWQAEAERLKQAVICGSN